ncbi:TD and POZ domain-containing protein 2 [Argiope bruennichi]|uniref:TD and POZ domain-containing protein 2 n=1 Tax=Argiope bruennichi TaxID=94029 RepID=A0A8T0EE48_ARGBR|nr:TD and POZ domain-containing protein 2 [Argiope bruennichi]
MPIQRNEKKCYCFTWRIENMSYIPEKLDLEILSPAFVVDEIERKKWEISLFPRGRVEESDKSIAVYLQQNEVANVDCRSEFEIAFVGEDGSILVSGTSKANFARQFGYGFPEFALIKEVFETKRSLFLPKDALTIRCRIWKIGETMSQDVQCFAVTRIGVQKISYLWNLENFSTLALEKKCNYLIKSPMNDASFMSVDLFVTEGKNSDKVICCALSLQDEAIKYCTLRLSLVDASGNRILCNQEKFWYDEEHKGAAFTFFFNKKLLLENKKLFLPNDILSLQWEWAFSEGIVHKKVEEIQHGHIKPEAKHCDDKKVTKDKIPRSSFKNNLRYFYREIPLRRLGRELPTYTFGRYFGNNY